MISTCGEPLVARGPTLSPADLKNPDGLGSFTGEYCSSQVEFYMLAPQQYSPRMQAWVILLKQRFKILHNLTA